jgi:hypothetical protein
MFAVSCELIDDDVDDVFLTLYIWKSCASSASCELDVFLRLRLPRLPIFSSSRTTLEVNRSNYETPIKLKILRLDAFIRKLLGIREHLKSSIKKFRNFDFVRKRHWCSDLSYTVKWKVLLDQLLTLSVRRSRLLLVRLRESRRENRLRLRINRI